MSPFPPRIRFSVAAVCLSLLVSPVLRAVINPAMQPRHLFELYTHVFEATVAGVDVDAARIDLKVEDHFKGKLSYGAFSIQGTEDQLSEVLSLQEGQPVVVFAGRKGRDPRRALYYLGGGTWHKAEMGGEDAPAAWTLTGDADEGVDPGSVEIMYAVFNGQVEMLARMVRDLAADRAYFPANPFTRFSARQVASLPAPVGGVAVHDLNGDGRLDLAATTGGGLAVFLQDDGGGFSQVEGRVEPAGAGTRSISIADVNGDGRLDLLLDGSLFLQDGGGVWRRSSQLEVDPDGVRSAAFADWDGDGDPDVVVSRESGGIRLYENTGGGDPFPDRTEARGIEPVEGKGGYFELGDWDRDNRVDILDLSGNGRLLLNRVDGFESVPLGGEWDEFTFATAAMAPIVNPDRSAAIVLVDDSKWLVENQDGKLVHITRYGNEIQDDVPGLRSVVVEDLGVDGTLDIMGFSGSAGSPDFFVNNRGYGSFMLPEKYESGLWPSAIYNNTVKTGVAAGDVTGDGANDLLIGAEDGGLWLLVNETLANRPAEAEAGTVLDARKRIESKSVTVDLKAARGGIGAWLRLSDAEGRLVAARQTGGNLNVGSWGPTRATFTVREPGAYRVEAVLSHGETLGRDLSLGADAPRHQHITLESSPETP